MLPLPQLRNDPPELVNCPGGLFLGQLVRSPHSGRTTFQWRPWRLPRRVACWPRVRLRGSSTGFAGLWGYRRRKRRPGFQSGAVVGQEDGQIEASGFGVGGGLSDCEGRRANPPVAISDFASSNSFDMRTVQAIAKGPRLSAICGASTAEIGPNTSKIVLDMPRTRLIRTNRADAICGQRPQIVATSCRRPRSDVLKELKIRAENMRKPSGHWESGDRPRIFEEWTIRHTICTFFWPYLDAG